MVWKNSKFAKQHEESGRFTSMWTRELRSRVLEAYVVEGKSMRDIAKKIECSHSAIQQFLEEKGVVRKKLRSKDNLPADKLLKKLYLTDKLTAPRIAKKLACPRYVIVRRLKALGVKRSFRDEVKTALLDRKPNSSWYLEVARLAFMDRDELAKMTGRQYLVAVRRATAYSLYRWNRKLKDPNNSEALTVDHKFPIWAGFNRFDEDLGFSVKRERPLPVWALAHPANLRHISRKENSRKCNKGIGVAELKKLISRFEQEHGDAWGKIKVIRGR